MSAESIAQRLIDSGTAIPVQIQSMPESQILDLESKYGVKFPTSYRDFLAKLGCSSTDLFSSYAFVYPGVEDLRQSAVDLAARNHFSMPANVFVILIQDDGFLYIRTDEGEDPPVYGFQEGLSQGDLVAQSFSEWLCNFTELMIEGAAARKMLRNPA